jgi:hypothetical protein
MECKRRTLPAFFGESEHGGRDRDRTDDLYRVKVALVPTELRALILGYDTESRKVCQRDYRSRRQPRSVGLLSENLVEQAFGRVSAGIDA